MDIQMILSALPGKPMGKAEPGANASDGQFALALAGAGRPQPAPPGELPAQLSAQLTEGVRPALPPSMSAQQVMLQALSASDPDLVADLEAAPLPDTLSLADIMERLALIDGNQPTEARPLPDIMERLALIDGNQPIEAHPLADAAALQTIAPKPLAPQAVAAEPASPADNAVAAVAAAEALRQTGDPARNLGEQPAKAATVSLNVHQTLLASQQAGREVSESTSRPGFIAQLDSSTTERPMRAAELVRAPDTAAASQLNTGDLRGVAMESLRPAVIEPTSPSLQTASQPGGNAAQAMPAPPTPVQASLPSPVQSQAWPSQLGQQLVQFARQGGEQQIEMRLNPADLGPLSVTLKMTEQGAQAQFLSAHAQVRQVLEQAIPQLREALAEQGISLGETSVGEQRHQEGQAFANQQGQRGNGANEADAPGLSVADIGMAESATGVSLDGRVNLYA